MRYKEIDGENHEGIKSVEEYIGEILKVNKNFKNEYLTNDNLFAAIDELIKINEELKENKKYDKTEKYVNSFIKNIRPYNINQANSNLIKYKLDINKKIILDDSKDVIDFFYRGVYNKNFKLLPSCHRNSHYGKESKYYHYFMTKCSSEFKQRNHLDSLVTLQHYDCPTRLLDITTNPLVALYFACKNYGCSECD